MCFMKGNYEDDLALKSYLVVYSLKIIQRGKTRRQKLERKDIGDVCKN